MAHQFADLSLILCPKCKATMKTAAPITTMRLDDAGLVSLAHVGWTCTCGEQVPAREHGYRMSAPGYKA